MQNIDFEMFGFKFCASSKHFLHQKEDQLNINEICGKVEFKPRLNLPKAEDTRACME